MAEQAPFTVQTTVSSTGAVITLGGVLDLVSVPALACALDDTLATLRETPPPSVVLRMAEVEFLAVAAARVIATAAQAWPGPGALVIRDPSPIVRRLLQVSGMGADLSLEEIAPSPPAP